MKITSKYTDAETTALTAAAARAGVKRSRYQRQATLDRLANDPFAYPDPVDPDPATRGATMGLSCWGSPENMDRACDLGVGWIRVSIEQGWQMETTLARWVTEAHDRGLKVLQCCQRNGHTYTAGYELEFGIWCANLVATGVDAIEILNEPNIVQFWAGTPDAVRAARYVGLAALSIRAKHPTLPIITPGLSPAPKPDWPAGFFPAMWDALTDTEQACITAAGHHPYCYPQDPLTYDWWNASRQIIDIHDAMDDRGIGHLQIWLTEFGSPTASFPSEDAQAEHMAGSFQAIDHWQAARSGLTYGPQFVHTCVDGQGASVPSEMTMGMFRADGSRKPVGDVVAARAAEATR